MNAETACDALIQNARLLTMAQGSATQVMSDAVVAWREGRIIFAGPKSELPSVLSGPHTVHYNADGNLVTPGLIDCHTHLVFAGDRATEFERRLEGVSYEEITKQGGGIRSTVTATRQTSEAGLFDESLTRARVLMAQGVSSIEIKSGYGLDLETERKMLRVARQIGKKLGLTVRTTYLAAHAVPPEFTGRADAYIDAVCEWMAVLQQEGLIDAVDGFCEGIGFSPAQIHRVFACAKGLGLPVKLHADQLSNLGGAALTAEFAGLSADHVEYTDAAAVARMQQAGTVAVLLPGAFHCLREQQRPPIAKFRELGVPMAVATDMNPGTSPLLSLPLAMSMACTHFNLTPMEALAGVTTHAATALGLTDCGQIKTGYRADIILWPFKNAADLSYWLPAPAPRAIFIAGKNIEQ